MIYIISETIYPLVPHRREVEIVSPNCFGYFSTGHKMIKLRRFGIHTSHCRKVNSNEAKAIFRMHKNHFEVK